MDAKYMSIAEFAVTPAADQIIWITPRANQGQIVEVSYSRGTLAGARTRSGQLVNQDAGEGDLYRRVVDHSDGSVQYAQFVPVDAIAYKYADPTEDARWVYDEADLAQIRSEDPSLIVPVP